MSESDIYQLKVESDTWKKLLSFLRDENIQLKNKLSETLKGAFDRSLLEGVEEFQSSFIKKDELIGLLRNDIVELDALLAKKVMGLKTTGIDLKLKQLRNNIIIVDREFAKLKDEFNKYLSANAHEL